MKLIRKTAAVFLAVFLLVCSLSPVISVYADGAADSGCPEGDGGTVQFSTYMSGIPKEPLDGKTPLSQPVFIRSLLEKAGKGYSQSNRYDVNFYDCSSLVQRCLRDNGITQNVPASTYYWDQMLQGYSVGDVVTFYGSDSYVQYRLTARDIPMIGNEAYFEKPGTIMVLIAPGLGSGHICVTLGSFSRQDEGLDPAADRLAIIENTENYVSSQMEAWYGVPASLFTGPGAVTGVRSVWVDDKNLGEDMTNKYGEPSGPYNRIWRVEAFNPSKGVCIDNCAHGTNYTNNVRYVLEPVENGPQEPAADAGPEIADISISNVTPEGFRVIAVFNAPAGLKDVLMPAWTEANGQDDLYWHVAGYLNEYTAYCDVKISDHNQESGKYIIHVQVTDVKGRIAVSEARAEVPRPEEPEEPEPPQEMGFTEAYVYDVTADGYSVHAEFIAPEGVAQILMPTWTEAGGQDDLIWHQAATEDGQTVDFRISTADHHSESGLYITHIYVTSPSGREIIAGVSADVPEPEPEEILEITGTEVDALTSGGYRVTAVFNAPNGVSEVLMPTWTDLNWQDDLQWHKADLDGNKAVYYVKTADHNNETGVYYTHVYVYDNTGAYVIEPLTIVVPEEEMTQPEEPEELAITDLVVTELSQDGFLVTATFTAPNGVSEVLMPTWTEANGQDDLIWHRAEISGDTASCYVRTADHNQESGLYITHVYVTDTEGNQVIAGTGAEVPEPGSPEEPEEQDELGFVSVYVADDSPNGYFVYTEFTAPDGISEVLMPTWTKANGQDDLIWYSAEIDSPDLPFESEYHTALCYIPVSDHNYEPGTYITHIYLKDPAGNQVIVGFEMTVAEHAEPEEPEGPEPPAGPGVYVYNGLDYAPVFDPEYYLNTYADLNQAFGGDASQAFSHFIYNGIYEGRTASPDFSVTAYKDRYADLREAFGDDLMLYVEHYLTNGIREGRIGN